MVLELDKLSPAQRAAVCYNGDHQCLILAGAGSGKTRVLTYRVAWLILNQGLSPASILAITFTNRAANEMRERTELLLGGKGMAAGLELKTFHAFGASFLRHYASYAGLYENFTIYAESDQRSLVKNILNTMSQSGVDGESRTALARQMVSLINKSKEAGLSPEMLAERSISAAEEHEAKVFAIYEAELRANNAVDFADLLVLPLMILRQQPEVCKRFHERYRHILVDEFQDTNAIQLALLKQMKGPKTKLTVVGDDDQSIYSWRGADTSGILDFPSQFGACELFKLEQNYRSTKPILACASKLIAHNVERNEKGLWTATNGGEPVRIIDYLTDRDEARDIVRRIVLAKTRKQNHWQDYAILYRKNSQSIQFETALTSQNVPYQVVGTVSFFEREEIVDLMTYLKVLTNPSDMVGLRRIINKPSRNIGPKLFGRITELMAEKMASGTPRAESFVAALHDIVDNRVTIPRGGAKFIEGCRQVLNIFEKTVGWQTRAPKDTLKIIMEAAAFDEHLQKTVPKKDQSYDEAKERIDQLMGMLDEHQEKSPNDLPSFLENMSLVRSESDSGQDSVKLMSIHGSKGLEFDTVFVTGLEAGILPLERVEASDIEEERRLMYVAMTRAKRHLFITHAKTRYEFGSLKPHDVSSFLNELMPEHVDETICSVEVVRLGQPSFGGARPDLAWSQPQKQRRNMAKTEDSNSGMFDENEPSATRLRRTKVGATQEADLFEADYYEEPTVDALSDVEEPPKPKRSASAYLEVKGLEPASAKSKNGKLITAGVRVSHSVHGQGVALTLETSGKDVKVLVDFKKAGQRMIIARFLERP